MRKIILLFALVFSFAAQAQRLNELNITTPASTDYVAGTMGGVAYRFQISSIIGPAMLGTGTADNTKLLDGTGAWKPIALTGDVTGTYVNGAIATTVAKLQSRTFDFSTVVSGAPIVWDASTFTLRTSVLSVAGGGIGLTTIGDPYQMLRVKGDGTGYEPFTFNFSAISPLQHTSTGFSIKGLSGLSGQGGKFLHVKTDTSGIDLVNIALADIPTIPYSKTSGFGAGALWDDYSDIPGLAGQGLKWLRIKSDASSVETFSPNITQIESGSILTGEIFYSNSGSPRHLISNPSFKYDEPNATFIHQGKNYLGRSIVGTPSSNVVIAGGGSSYPALTIQRDVTTYSGILPVGSFSYRLDGHLWWRGDISEVRLDNEDLTKSSIRSALGYTPADSVGVITWATPGTSGTAPNWSTSNSKLGTTATINIPPASGTGVTAGLIAKTDYDKIQTSYGWGNHASAGYALASSILAPPFSDANTLIKNSSNATKLLKISAANISASTTRTLTAQDANYIIAGTNISNTFSADQVMSGTLDVNKIRSIAGNTNVNGSSGLYIGDAYSGNNYSFTSFDQGHRFYGFKGLTFPAGATSQRPTWSGMLTNGYDAGHYGGVARYNTDTRKNEFFENNVWVNYRSDTIKGTVKGISMEIQNNGVYAGDLALQLHVAPESRFPGDAFSDSTTITSTGAGFLFNFVGDTTQYIMGNGKLKTFPSLSGSGITSFTTTGSGPATFSGGALNIPTPGASYITSLTTTGSGSASVSGGVLNIPTYSGITGIGTFSNTGATNGATTSGSDIIIHAATATTPGALSLTTQILGAGDKILNQNGVSPAGSGDPFAPSFRMGFNSAGLNYMNVPNTYNWDIGAGSYSATDPRWTLSLNGSNMMSVDRSGVIHSTGVVASGVTTESVYSSTSLTLTAGQNVGLEIPYDSPNKIYHLQLYSSDYSPRFDVSSSGGGYGDAGISFNAIGTGTFAFNSLISFPSVAFGSRTITSSLSATLGDYQVLADASSGAITYTLPDVYQFSGRIINVKKIDSSGNDVTVSGTGSSKIDGASSLVISTQYLNKTFISDGTNWFLQ